MIIERAIKNDHALLRKDTQNIFTRKKNVINRWAIGYDAVIMRRVT